MEGLQEFLSSPTGQQFVNGIAGDTGQSNSKTADILSIALPLLVGGMKKNVASADGAESFMNALSSKHDGSILDDLDGLFDGGVDQSVKDDGAGILRHVLGDKQDKIEQTMSEKSGVDTGSIGNILQIAAPFLMGYIGRETSQNNISDATGINSMFVDMLRSLSPDTKNLITGLLDSYGRESILDDVAEVIIRDSKKKRGRGGLFSGLWRR